MTSAQEARADGWQRDAGRYLAALTAATRENRQLREQLAAKGHAMTAEPVPDTDAFADARDRITWQNQAVREAVRAERERIRQLAADSRAIVITDGGWIPFTGLLDDDVEPPLIERSVP